MVLRSTRLAPKWGAEDQALGRSRGGLSTKSHLAVRGLGVLVRVAQVDGLPAEVVMADATYDVDPRRKAITARRAVGALAVGPSKPFRPQPPSR